MKQVKDIKESVIRRTFNDETLIMAMLFKWQNEITEREEFEANAIPLRLCALIESYVRLKYSEIINNDEAALGRLAKNYKEQIKLNVLVELKKENFSIGSFMAYQFPCSSIKCINDAFKTILERDFIAELCKEKKGANLLELLNQMYSKRHELAHEIAWDINLEKDEALSYIDATRFFILFIKNFLKSYTSNENIEIEDINFEFEANKSYGDMSRIENPETPMTQYEMNMASLNAFEEAEKELDRIVAIIKEKLPEYCSEDMDYIPLWKEYRKQKAEIIAKSYEGGSIYPLIYNDVMEECTQQEIKMLKEKYSTILASI